MTEAVIRSAEGRDFSDFQKIQTVAEVKADDFDFAKATEGTGWISHTFAANWANMKAAGKPRGAYHFLHPGEDPIAQARHFYAVVKAAGIRPGDMLVVDSELPSGALHGAEVTSAIARNHLPVTPADLTAMPAQVDVCTKAFLDELSRLLIADGHFTRTGILRRKTLVNPLITYTMHVVGRNLVETAKAYPLLWFAWPSNTAPPAGMYAPWKSWLFWQWGTRNGVDTDAFNGTAAGLAAFIRKYIPVRVHKLLIVEADGKTSLRQYARKYGTNPAWIIAWTYRNIAWQANQRFSWYVISGKWDAPLRTGTKLAIWEWVEELPGA